VVQQEIGTNEGVDVAVNEGRPTAKKKKKKRPEQPRELLAKDGFFCSIVKLVGLKMAIRGPYRLER